MHETVLLSRVVRLVEEQLADQPHALVLAVRLGVGRRSHLVDHDPASLTTAFEVAAAGSRVQGATLLVDVIEEPRGCDHCGQGVEADRLAMSCPRCGALVSMMVEEPVLWLREIVIEDSEPQ